MDDTRLQKANELQVEINRLGSYLLFHKRRPNENIELNAQDMPIIIPSLQAALEKKKQEFMEL